MTDQTLYQSVLERVNLARTKVDELRQGLQDFDAKQSGATGREKASAYFGLALDKAQEALTELGKQAQTLKDNATEIPVRAFSVGFAKANDALTEIKDRARLFDDQHGLTTKVSDVVHNPREQATVALASASSYVTEAAHGAFSQLQGVSDGIKVRVVAAAEQGLDKVLPVAASCDGKLQISERTAKIAQQVKQFDEQYHVSDKLIDLDNRWALSQYFTSVLNSLGSLDQRVTGGSVQPVVNSAYEMGLQMAGFVSTKYEETKAKVAEDEAKAAAPAPPKEAPAEVPAAPSH